MKSSRLIATLVLFLLPAISAFCQNASPTPARHHRKKVHSDGVNDPSPSPTAAPHFGANATPDGDAADSNGDATPRKLVTPGDAAAPSPTRQASAAPDATIDPGTLVEFSKQPERTRKILQTALDLTSRNLTYTYGSADPAAGGMDCSGFVYYVLQQNGFADVPRDASGQYVWLRKAELFHAVLSRRSDSFEMADLRPGDLLFWTGTYQSSHDPPITHAMIYLGSRKDGSRVMVGSSDGRSFEGKTRWGVSVFDFKVETHARDAQAKSQSLFVGYAHLPAAIAKDR